MIIHNPILTGSFTFNGTDVSSVTGSSTYSASFASSLNSLNVFTASAATTGSNTFVGNQVVSGSLTTSGSITATGTLTAQTLVVQTITSSVDYVTGSTRFGSLLANTHTFTGSVLVTGSVNATNYTFTDGQYIRNSNTSNANGSLYLDASNLYIRRANDGTNLMFVSSSGNIGIGTTAPGAKFEVAAPGTAAEIRINANTTTDNEPTLTFYSSYASTSERNWGIRTSVYAVGDFTLNQSPASGSSPFVSGNTRLYISPSGNVGIGTSTASYALDVNGAGRFISTGANIISKNTTTSQANLIRYDNSSGTARAYLGYETGGSAFYIENTEGLIYNYVSGGLALTLNADKSAAFASSINTGGNVGVNLTSAYTLKSLTVNNSMMFMNTSADGNTNTLIGSITSQVRNYGSGVANASFASINFYTDPSTYYYGDIRFLTNNTDSTATAGTERMRITSAGNVGIGTTNPDRALDVTGLSAFRQPNATNSTTLSILQTSTGGNGFNDTGLVVQTNAGDGTTKIAHFYDYNSGTPISRMAILRGGNIGIGTTNPSTNLHILANASVQSAILRLSGYGGASTDTWDMFATTGARVYIWNVSTNNGAYLVYNSSSGWTSVSDARWKTNWTPLTNSLGLINQLNVGKYKMLDGDKNPVENARWDYGVKAQEILEIIPDAVDVPNDPEDKHGVIHNIVFYNAVKAIQELSTQLQELKTEFDEYKTTHP